MAAPNKNSINFTLDDKLYEQVCLLAGLAKTSKANLLRTMLKQEVMNKLPKAMKKVTLEEVG
jgi:hypothetical protein